MISINDVFGRTNPKVVWNDVPDDSFKMLMNMDENERNKILDKLDQKSADAAAKACIGKIINDSK